MAIFLGKQYLGQCDIVSDDTSEFEMIDNWTQSESK
jgi:hypothetical protein